MMLDDSVIPVCIRMTEEGIHYLSFRRNLLTCKYSAIKAGRSLQDDSTTCKCHSVGIFLPVSTVL